MESLYGWRPFFLVNGHLHFLLKDICFLDNLIADTDSLRRPVVKYICYHHQNLHCFVLNVHKVIAGQERLESETAFLSGQCDIFSVCLWCCDTNVGRCSEHQSFDHNKDWRSDQFQCHQQSSYLIPYNNPGHIILKFFSK